MKASGQQIRESVREAYSAAATRPEDRHAFPAGRAFAEALGYPGELLESLPPASVQAFDGVSNVSLFAEIPPGATVFDLGCGAALDSLVAARRTGAAGEVVGIDFSETMLARARCAAREAGAHNVLFCRAGAEALPLADASVDVALVNGIFNLNPAREAIFRELARVLRPEGAVFAAEMILLSSLPESQQSEADWFA